MGKVFTDENFLRWEVYSSGADLSHSEQPFIVFNCVSDAQLRARHVECPGDEADAERIIANATQEDLLQLFRRAHAIK